MLIGSYLKAGLLGALLFVIAGCDYAPPPAAESLYSGKTMGTTWSIKVVGHCSLKQQQFDDRLIAINQVASTYLEDSELSLLNANADARVEALISEDLAEIISISQRISRVSDGAFDVTVGPVVNLWGFGPSFRATPPDAEQIEHALQWVGDEAVKLDGQNLSYDSRRLIDLSAVAKGWAVDQLGLMLEEANCDNYLAEIGGELLAKGLNSKQKPWRLAVEKPTQGGREAMQVIAVVDSAVATSGDYRNYYEFEGKRYSHTIDPATGMPIEHQVASVTVVAPTAAEADAWATAFNVMGVEKGLQLANEEGLAVMFIEYNGDKLKVTSNDAFEALKR